MIEYYAQIKLAHVTSVIASGALLATRGLLVQAGRAPLALSAPLRYLSHAIDTALLTAALMLVSILPVAVFSNGWLYAKLLLLPAYVVFGWLALRRGGPAGKGIGYFVAAIVTYGLMFSIARAHHPLGSLGAFLGA